MHRLYILGALALAKVNAYVNVGVTGTVATTNTAYGSATYTATGDCFSANTAVSLGMNNIHY
jgi:hypothetical protein